MRPDRIALETPIERGWEPVFRLVLGGVADRLDLGFEDLDDIQLAVERLLAEAGTQETVQLSFEILPEGLRTRIGPLHEHAIAEALQGPDARPGELTLRRILETVVDSFGVEIVDDGQILVILNKRVRRPRPRPSRPARLTPTASCSSGTTTQATRPRARNWSSATCRSCAP